MIAVFVFARATAAAVAAAVARECGNALHELRVLRMHTDYVRYLNALATRRGAISALTNPPSPLDAVSHTAPAEGEGIHPGGVIRGISPCATKPPHRDVSRSARLRVLAKRARADTLEPGWPFNATGNWSGCLEGMLGGATGEYCAALRPDVVVALLDERDRWQAALTQIGFHAGACCTGHGVHVCTELVGSDRADWCSYCTAREALSYE